MADDLVERVARAIEQSLIKGGTTPLDAHPYSPEAKVAIALALEEAAKVAEGCVKQECCGNLVADGSTFPECCGSPNVIPMYPNEIATAIRAMIKD
jgi:hypothetical protein